MSQPIARAWRPSPNFLLPLMICFVSGALLFTGSLYAPVGVFIFVMSGWIVSLCLHEGGHAYAAYQGGDTSVEEQGYLSLDPLAYAHPLLSVGLPVLFLLVGGIGLPGAAVYIDHSRLRNRNWEAIVAMAGPLANLVLFVLLALPFMMGLHEAIGTPRFWTAIALLAFLQASAVVLNLLPIPGLDGFGIIRPYLPPDMREQAENAAPMLGMLLLVLLMTPAFASSVWRITYVLADLAQLDPRYISAGWAQFRFWRL